ncbi:MAG: PorT family protein [Chitinophagaceae bacterium]|nr:MAG: PorT family protein [Chitinophagaceae bacterium]
MLYLQCQKTKQVKSLLLGLLVFFSISASAQRELNMEEHDYKPYYFGISLGLNRASFHSELHPDYLNQDSILTAEPSWSAGFNLGLSATVRLNQRFELRFNPQLIFTERNVLYNLRYKDAFENLSTIQKKVESVITSFPFQLRFMSDRIGNFRVYMMGGVKVDMDLASNAQARKADDMLKIQRMDYGIEAGVGFKFYYPSFILAPEIKISNGLGNVHSRNDKLNYSRVLGDMRSRMVVLTIHLEG